MAKPVFETKETILNFFNDFQVEVIDNVIEIFFNGRTINDFDNLFANTNSHFEQAISDYKTQQRDNDLKQKVNAYTQDQALFDVAFDDLNQDGQDETIVLLKGQD